MQVKDTAFAVHYKFKKNSFTTTDGFRVYFKHTSGRRQKILVHTFFGRLALTDYVIKIDNDTRTFSAQHYHTRVRDSTPVTMNVQKTLFTRPKWVKIQNSSSRMRHNAPTPPTTARPGEPPNREPVLGTTLYSTVYVLLRPSDCIIYNAISPPPTIHSIDRGQQKASPSVFYST